MQSRIPFLTDFIAQLTKNNPGCTYWIIKPLVKPTKQRGGTCGIVSANHVLKLFHAANSAYSYLPARKGDDTPRGKKSLRSLYKEVGISGIGALFDTAQFKLFLNPADYDAETVLFENQAEMTQILLSNLMRNKSVIISCDMSDVDQNKMKIMGTKGSGEHPHYVTIVGYYQKRNGSLHYIYASWQEWLQVSEEDLFLSSNCLKMYSGCTEYKLAKNNWTTVLPSTLTDAEIAKLNKFITPVTDLSKIRNCCVLITPKSFNEIQYYSRALKFTLNENYPINIDVVKTLIQAGAKVEAKDFKHWLVIPKDLTLESIIQAATFINQLMEYVIFKESWDKCDKNTFIQLMKDHAVRMNIGIDDEPSLLHRAVKANNDEILPYLIQYGLDVDVNMTTSYGKKTLLHYAVYQDNIKIINFLLKKDKINLNAKDNDLQTPLHAAIIQNCTDIAMALVKAGADVHAEDMHYHTPLYKAVCIKEEEILTYLLNHKDADSYKIYTKGENILQTAVKTGCITVLSILLTKYKNHLHEKDNLENSLLHLAAMERDFDMMQYLITEHQFDVNAKNLKGKTPKDYFIEKSKNINQNKWVIEQSEMAYEIESVNKNTLGLS